MTALKQLVPLILLVFVIVFVAQQLTSGGRRLTCPVCKEQAKIDCTASCKDSEEPDSCLVDCIYASCHRCISVSGEVVPVVEVQKSSACLSCISEEVAFCDDECAPAATICRERCATRRCGYICEQYSSSPSNMSFSTEPLVTEPLLEEPLHLEEELSPESRASQIAFCQDCLRLAEVRCGQNCPEEESDPLASKECFRGCAKILCRDDCKQLAESVQ